MQISVKFVLVHFCLQSLYTVCWTLFVQCFDTVGWVTGRASGLLKRAAVMCKRKKNSATALSKALTRDSSWRLIHRLSSSAPSPSCIFLHVVRTQDGDIECRSRRQNLTLVFLWSPYGIGQTIIFPCCGLFFLLFLLSFFSSPNLSRRRLDVYHTSAHGVVLV